MIPKFRAWDKVEKEWLSIRTIGFDDDGSLWYLQAWDDNENDIDPPYLEDDLGVKWELLQSTGLKDKNDVEIFEGDVVKVKAEDPEPKIRADRYETGVIIYAYGSFDIETKPNTVSGLIPESNLTDIRLTFEVIGNIYQHPHLLEE